MAELINRNKIGVVKGTLVEDAVEANFKGETTEVGLYLAMARQAQIEILSPHMLQGSLAIECRSDDEEIIKLFSKLDTRKR